VPNGTGKQPTYRIADLTNPNLKPWVGGGPLILFSRLAVLSRRWASSRPARCRIAT
jgi:hypothetical protein